jgi:hypothetical protein
MLYKVTPMMPSAKEEGGAEQARGEREPRRKRRSAVFDSEGHEVLITLTCQKCRKMKPLAQFGLRKMADGAIRNQPWCRTCRGAAGTRKDRAAEPAPVLETSQPEVEVQQSIEAAEASSVD